MARIDRADPPRAVAGYAGRRSGGRARGAEGTFGDDVISASFVNDLSGSLTSGSSALIVLVREITPEKVLPHILEPGTVLHGSLCDELDRTARCGAGSSEAQCLNSGVSPGEAVG